MARHFLFRKWLRPGVSFSLNPITNGQPSSAYIRYRWQDQTTKDCGIFRRSEPFQISRMLSTINITPIEVTREKFEAERHQFTALFPEIVRELTEVVEKYGDKTTTKRFAKCLQYIGRGGKTNRGVLVVSSYKCLVDKKYHTPEDIKRVQTIGWCLEIIHKLILIWDDIVDNSTVRNGQPCWYKRENIGLAAINDAVLLENAVFLFLKSKFRNLSCYLNIIELLHETIYVTITGQNLDIFGEQSDVYDFTMAKYLQIVEQKTAFYTFVAPFLAATYFVEKPIKDLHTIKNILTEIGIYFQCQDDYLDCFGDEKIIGKVGTDIQDHKCSWLAVKCMQLANDDQKKIMSENYGHSDPEKVDKIKQLYMALNLPDVYKAFEEEMYQKINTSIEKSSGDVPRELLYYTLNNVFHRFS